MAGGWAVFWWCALATRNTGQDGRWGGFLVVRVGNAQYGTVRVMVSSAIVVTGGEDRGWRRGCLGQKVVDGVFFGCVG